MSKAHMAYNYLGRSGLRVFNIGFGAMTLCRGPQDFPSDISDEKDAHKCLEKYAEMGGNFDTSNSYGNGMSETYLGSWLRLQKRQDFEDFVIATKVRSGINGGKTGLSRRGIITELEQSLKRLQTDYVDLYQIHCWDSATPIEETAMVLDDMVRAGKVRYIGASNLSGWQLQKYMDICKQVGLHRFICLQPQYRLLVREAEGLLTGKYKKGKLGDATGRVAYASNRGVEINSLDLSTVLKDERTWAILEKLESIAKKYGKSVSQVALRWLLQKPFIPAVIVGATSLKQLEDNMGASSDWELSEEEEKELDDVSKPNLPYPYGMISRENAARINPYNT